jgi:NIMA-interacting peptidyl-prolyl cis-trans isomerase 1
MSELQSYERTIISEATSGDLGTVFANYAGQRSDCSSFKSGGDLGFFGPGQMQKPFEDASFALQPNEMSKIVATDSGLHLIFRIA